MADECDMAQDMEALHRRIALESLHSATTGRNSLYYCEECGDPIPEARRQAVPGVSLCLECQEEADACHR
ncbi:MAG: TraR/DksA C4-type zinc finger protein [Pseudodesulfovibrio sp.]|jgi:phage/conjugal plasmid C-4 type zinc finger TraR family protein|uniref:TraR/DksA C4-type zinc finger protein n=1 Tax=Pseudodesulfovibrio sp. TaxID=2035812 RepID=UPI003D0AA4B9